MLKEEIKQVWLKRTLIWTFAIYEIKRRYRNTVLGFFWSLLEPLLLLSVLYVVFSYLFVNTIENYQLYLLLGIIMWRMFAYGTNLGLMSLLEKKPILKKIYFPREVIPLSTTASSLIVLSLELIIFGIFVIFSNLIPSFSMFMLIPIIIIESCLILGFSFILAVINVKVRDLQHVWSVVLTAGFFATPILYSIDRMPEQIREILYLNPMTHIVELAHNTVLYNNWPSFEEIFPITAFSIAILFIGYGIYRHFVYQAIEEL